jgi:hypothetical protein
MTCYLSRFPPGADMSAPAAQKFDSVQYGQTPCPTHAPWWGWWDSRADDTAGEPAGSWRSSRTRPGLSFE